MLPRRATLTLVYDDDGMVSYMVRATRKQGQHWVVQEWAEDGELVARRRYLTDAELAAFLSEEVQVE